MTNAVAKDEFKVAAAFNKSGLSGSDESKASRIIKNAGAPSATTAGSSLFNIALERSSAIPEVAFDTKAAQPDINAKLIKITITRKNGGLSKKNPLLSFLKFVFLLITKFESNYPRGQSLSRRQVGQANTFSSH